MSTRQRGNRRENDVIAHLEAKGYWCAASRGSRGIDIVCFAPPDSTLPHLAIEAGGRAKSVVAALAKMRESTRPPGSVLLVVRQVKERGRNVLRWHSTEGRGHDSLEDALSAARS